MSQTKGDTVRRRAKVGKSANVADEGDTKQPDDPKRAAVEEAKAKEEAYERQQTRRMYQQLALGIFGVVSALVFRFLTSTIDLPQIPSYPPFEVPQLHPGAVERLRGFLRIPTVSLLNFSEEEQPARRQHFKRAVEYLQQSYPRVWEEMDVELVSDLSLLMTWRGSDPSRGAIVSISHIDVVPTEGQEWTQPPFEANVVDGQIYARGAKDTKSTLMAMLEASTMLLEQGWRPSQSLVFCFGHDEETQGVEGATQIAAALLARGLHVEAILDEGGIVATDGLVGLGKAIAIVGVAEKGNAQFRGTVYHEGGHTALPPIDHSSVPAQIAKLATEIVQNPPQSRLISSIKGLCRRVAKAHPNILKAAVLANVDNPWIEKLVKRVFAAKAPSTAALVRTTAALIEVTTNNKAANVMPSQGSLQVNFRLLPGDTWETAIAYLHNVAARAQVNVSWTPEGSTKPPSPESPASGRVWDALERSLYETIGPSLPQGLLVAPYLLIGQTDSRHFSELGVSTYRVSPILVNVTKGDLSQLHGLDERIGVEEYMNGVRFYYRLFMLAVGEIQDKEPSHEQQLLLD